jgi:hypothetical protein
MESQGNLVPETEQVKLDKPDETSLESQKAPTESPKPLSKAVEGKSAEEIALMFTELEKDYTKKSMELAEAKKQKEVAPIVEEPKVEEETNIDDLVNLFAPDNSKIEDPEEKKQVEFASNLQLSNLKMRIKLDCIEARSDKSMPMWNDVESDVLNFTAKYPYFLNQPNWTKEVYDLVAAKKQASELDARLKEAEERGKIKVIEQEKPKDDVQVISTSEIKTPPPPPPITKEDKMTLVKQGKLSWQDYIAQECLSEDERKWANKGK